MATALINFIAVAISISRASRNGCATVNADAH
jgi:hypothetical protein